MTDEQERAEDLAAVADARPQEAIVAMSRLMNVAAATMERRAQLEEALQSRIVIEQAKGVLAERYGVGIDEAFGVLRQGARSNRMKLRDLAQLVVETKTTPPQLPSALEPRRR